MRARPRLTNETNPPVGFIEIITASVAVENKASAHMLEKCDFIRTARYVEEDWGFDKPVIVDKWFC